MKRIYQQPSVEMANYGMEEMICASKDITSELGIDYGGVDEDGTKDPASRQNCSVWEDEENEEDWH